ncbi:ral GTPase-activating protein subunit alpha-1-like isoform X2 [Ptychodera flava]|uniref:ral GTPase-activating protein subunit alpha-1-like isoform X2 n=1 Tax=Ptychodera flava TaxID=63121 RepID=UPI00396A4856
MEATAMTPKAAKMTAFSHIVQRGLRDAGDFAQSVRGSVRKPKFEMFSKKQHGDVKKSSQKVLDPKKDPFTRLKHLRVILDHSEIAEAKAFFEQYYSHVYQVFYENFISVEASLKQKVHKAQREELDGILYVFEKLLVLLPDYIHERWQFHSIGRLLKKLLHPGNALKLRREGIRLFLLWFQALQEHADEECYLIYATLVPGFPQPEGASGIHTLDSLINNSARPPSSVFLDFTATAVTPVEITPLISPQSGEKVPENVTKFLLEAVLHFSVSQINKMEWRDMERKERSFMFLFENFKKYYLPVIFPEISQKTDIYDPVLDVPEFRTRSFDQMDNSRRDPILACRVSVVRWVVAFTNTRKQTPKSSVGDEGTLKREDSKDMAESVKMSDREDNNPPSNSSTLTNQSDRDTSTSSMSSMEESQLQTDAEIVRDVLYSTRANVNFVHEIFRQAFLLTSADAPAMRKVIRVYQDWIQNDDKPVFMLEPCEMVLSQSFDMSPDSPDSPGYGEDNGEFSGQLRSIGNQTEMETGATAATMTSPHIPGVPYKRFSQSDSYLGAINQAEEEAMEQCNVRAGQQATLQVFITNSANVFLLEPASDPLKVLDDQVDMCKRVLHIYRHMVMNAHMSKRTWEQLLMVLLRITEVILKTPPEKGYRKSLSKDLAAVLFQTLIVTWIKANLNVFISTDLWDELLRVLSSLTHWEELIREWAKTMETLTRVLARHVYNLDLSDLPLDKLSEQKQKRRRGRQLPSQKTSGHHERSFSKGWSRTDSLSPNAQEEFERLRQSMTGMANAQGSRGEGEGFRQRSATTVGPGVSVTDGSSAASAAAAAMRLRHKSTGEAPFQVSDDGSGRRQFLRQQSLSCTEPDMSDEEESKSPLTKSSSTGDLREDPIGFRLKGQSFSSELSSVTTSSGVTGSTAATDSISIGDVVTMPVFPQNLALTDDQDLASLATLGDTVSLDSTNQGDHSGDHSGEHSSSSMFEIGRVSPPLEAGSHIAEDGESRSSSRSPSPALFMQQKDSPTQESLQLDTVVSADEIDNDETDGTYLNGTDTLQPTSAEMNCHVILGGARQGWLPDVAVVLWKRMLGILGDVNEIKDPTIHAEVFEYLWDLWVVFSKIRDNLGISVDNLSTPPPPRLVPPHRVFSPWLFKAVSLTKNYQRGRLLAYRLLCAMTVRRHDEPVPMDHMIQFYRILHHGLVGTDQDVINTIVRHTSPMFFSCSLPSSTMLVLDYIQATNMIVSSQELDAPRVEAISILGSLICFPNMYCNMQALQPNSSDITTMSCKDLKDHIISILLKAGRKEPHFEARCVALSCLGVFVYEEVMQGTYHSKLKEAINVLLATIKGLKYIEDNFQTGTVQRKSTSNFPNKAVAQVASDMLLLLCYQADKIRHNQPELPKKIIEVIALTILSLLPSTEASHNEDDKKLMVSLLFCMLEWCMALPVKVLSEPVENRSEKGNKPLLTTVFRVLQAAAQGVVSHQKQTLINFSDIASNDYDPHVYIDNVRENFFSSGANSPRTPVQLEGIEDFYEDDSLLAPIISDFHRRSADVVRIAAKTVMSHLMSHLGHFPLACGPARVNTLVSEYHDNPAIEVDELSTELYSCPNVQFFVCNNSFLMSCVEIPAELEAPGGGVTAGLTTAKTQCRVVLRDLSGKFVWDSAILYGPPECAIYQHPDVMGGDSSCNDGEIPSDVFSGCQEQRQSHDPLVRQRSKLPSWEDTEETQDVLDELLQYIGHTSNECLQKPGQPLNIPAMPPEEITSQMQTSIKSCLLQQYEIEEEYVQKHAMDTGTVSKPQEPWPHREPASPFYICRLMLSQMGMMAWEKRASFDLLKKNDKLIRELKNLDSQLCRETHKIAVIYVAEGQEDKNSVLTNSGGSQAYENFLAGLAWEADLTTHTGFMGGLQRNKSTGDTAPFYATSASEVIFHVATRMPTAPDDLTKKLRHLGNDEVHIVWSEHTRDYRRGIIATEFGDVLICIYPLPNQLYRVQIQRKPEVQYFGPLFDGAIVGHKVLPGLVRATAINASRVKRSSIPLYQRFYEERAKYLDAIIKNHKDPTTFEEFASHVYAPAHDKIQRSVPMKNYHGEVSSVASASSASVTSTVEHTGSVSSLRSSTSSQATVTSTSRAVKEDHLSGEYANGDESHAKSGTKGKLTNKSRQPSNSTGKDGTPPDSPGTSLKGKRAS